MTHTMITSTLDAIPPGAAATRVQVIEVADARSAALSRLRAIDPPEEFTVEHAGLIAALTTLIDAGDTFLSETAGMTAEEFHGALDASTEIDTLAAQFAAVCGVWEQRAADLGHTADLDC